MSMTRDQIAQWLDEYFAAANEQQGAVESVAYLRRFFTDDFQFWMYTAPPFITPPLDRDGLLMTFVHPGIYEQLTPKYYVIDVESLVAVVQFELCFRHEMSGKAWRPLQASAHYHLRVDGSGRMQIGKIQYWTQSHVAEDDYDSLFGLWDDAKQSALAEFAAKHMRGES